MAEEGVAGRQEVDRYSRAAAARWPGRRIKGRRVRMTDAARGMFPRHVGTGVAQNLYCNANGVQMLTVVSDGRKSREHWASSFWKVVEDTM